MSLLFNPWWQRTTTGKGVAKTISAQTCVSSELFPSWTAGTWVPHLADVFWGSFVGFIFWSFSLHEVDLVFHVFKVFLVLPLLEQRETENSTSPNCKLDIYNRDYSGNKQCHKWNLSILHTSINRDKDVEEFLQDSLTILRFSAFIFAIATS